MNPKKFLKSLKGVVHLVMTPFDDDGELNEEALRDSLSYTMEKLKGEDAVFLAGGSTAEFYAMTDEECLRYTKIVTDEVGGAFPVLVGTSRAGTRYTAQVSLAAQEAGADAVLVVNPYYHTTTEDGLYRHYRTVAESVEIGVVIYNNAVTSKLWISPDLMGRLAKIDNIVGDKENVSNPVLYRRMQNAVDPDDMVIFCGLGHEMFSFEALYGCPAYVTELANFAPQAAVEIYRSAKEGRFDDLSRAVSRLDPYMQFLAKAAARRGSLPTILSPQVSISGLPLYQTMIKESMKIVGLPMGKVREPMENLTGKEIEELREALEQSGIPS